MGYARLPPRLVRMNDGDALCERSALDQAALVARGELSARDLLDAHLDRIERVNPAINAIVTLVPERAREWAAAADEKQARGEPLGPLHGLPIAHKDAVMTAGIRTTMGSPLLADNVPTTDDLLVERVARYAPGDDSIKTVFKSMELDDWGIFRDRDLTTAPPRSPHLRAVHGVGSSSRFR